MKTKIIIEIKSQTCNADDLRWALKDLISRINNINDITKITIEEDR